MIAVSCAIRVLGGGLHAYGLSIFFLPVTQELELTRTSTSLVFSLARAQGAVEGPLAGYCIDRYGPRPVITIAVLLAGLGYLLLARVHSYAALLIVYMGVISLSYQAGFMDATMALANTWFIRKRALAMSLTSGSIALGGTLLTPFLAYAVHTEQQGALCLTIIAVCGMPTHLLIGWLADRFNKTRLMAGFMVIASFSVYLLFAASRSWLLAIGLASFSVLEGLFPVTWATVGDFFGRRNFAKIRGGMSFLYTWGSVLGPVIAGAIYDRTRNYAALLWILLGLCWITAVIYALLAPPQSIRHGR